MIHIDILKVITVLAIYDVILRYHALKSQRLIPLFLIYLIHIHYS